MKIWKKIIFINVIIAILDMITFWCIQVKSDRVVNTVLVILVFSGLMAIIGIIGSVVTTDMHTENTNDKYKKLQQLQKLKDSGAISEVEYEVEKQKLLR